MSDMSRLSGATIIDVDELRARLGNIVMRSSSNSERLRETYDPVGCVAQKRGCRVDRHPICVVTKAPD